MELVAVLGILGGVLTALGTILTALNARRRDQRDEAAQVRKELRDEVTNLRAELKDCDDGRERDRLAYRTEVDGLWARISHMQTRIFELERQTGFTPHEGMERPPTP